MVYYRMVKINNSHSALCLMSENLVLVINEMLLLQNNPGQAALAANNSASRTSCFFSRIEH